MVKETRDCFCAGEIWLFLLNLGQMNEVEKTILFMLTENMLSLKTNSAFT